MTMKKFIFTSIAVALFATGTTLVAQDNQKEYLGLPGDNLNLYAVMRLFQESKTLEDFERNLNDPNSTINNLDLNGDNLVDYIKVIDNVDRDVHNIVLQVAVSPVQNQDVAVFTVQRFQNGQVFIQLTGDEELYGKNYIVEPITDNANTRETPNPGYTGNNQPANVNYVRTTPFEIAAWPLIRFIFLPSYIAWHSTWYWGYYPTYWHPWRPFSWNYYYGFQNNWNRYYLRHYHQTDIRRYDRWNDFYYHDRRAFSPDVDHKIRVGDYRTTYSHPEQRSEGEARFAEKHPDQYRRSSNIPSGNNRNMNQRPGSTVINRPQNNQQPGNNRVSTQKPNPSGNVKSSANRPTDNNTVTSRRPNNTVTDKAMMNRPSQPNTSANKMQNQSKPTVVNSSGQRDNKKIKSETTIKKDNQSKEPEQKETDHRH